MVGRIERYLNQEDLILDVGAGTCHITKLLRCRNYQVTPLDVKDLSLVDGIKPIIYDRVSMPFDNDSFDVALILTVLHHTENPFRVIKEAMRVSKRLIIMEDIYVNGIHKYITFFVDSLSNFQFSGHPHTNSNDQEWRSLFRRAGLNIRRADYRRSLLVLLQGTYYLYK